MYGLSIFHLTLIVSVLIITDCIAVDNNHQNDVHQKITTRIINGKVAKPHQFPYQVSLKSYVLPDSKALSSWCGGSLISESFVLTAAHCIYTFKYTDYKNGSVMIDYQKRQWVYYIDIFLGAHNLKKINSKNQKIFKVHVSNCITYPYYDAFTTKHDIALIRLPEPVVLSNKIAIINLPPRSMNDLVGEYLISSGWGVKNVTTGKSSNVLRYVKTKVISNKECNTMFVNADDKAHLCTYDPKGSSSCTGDSGGPNVFVAKNGIKYLIGITSFSNYKGCGPESPQVLTRVRTYLDWISKETGIKIED